jgi:hypothetical protein
MTDVSIEHRRGIRRCRCGERHTRNEIIHFRDQRQRIVHPGGEAGAKLTGWASYRSLVNPDVPYLSRMRIDELQRTIRMHSPSRLDPSTCIAPLCTRPQPCIYRQTAVAELVEAGVEPWTPDA